MKLEHRDSADDREPLLTFLDEHWVMTLATCAGGIPYATPVFFALADRGETFIFLSKTTTRHTEEFLVNENAAAGVYLETEKTGLIQGAQISGCIIQPKEEERNRLEKIYYKRHPTALALKHIEKNVELFALKASRIKLTDNRLGFGKQIEWIFD